MGIAQAEMGRARTFTPSFAGLRRPADTLKSTVAKIAHRRPQVSVAINHLLAHVPHPHEKTPQEIYAERLKQHPAPPARTATFAEKQDAAIRATEARRVPDKVYGHFEGAVWKYAVDPPEKPHGEVPVTPQQEPTTIFPQKAA